MENHNYSKSFYFEVPDDVRTKVTKFEDEADVLVSANRSIYSTGTSQDGVNVTAQSGHTSNIKDILCMMDVNFNDINNSDDESLKTFLECLRQDLTGITLKII